MTGRALPARFGRLPALVVALLVVAVLADRFLVRPQFAELRRLEAQRDELLRRQVAAQERDRRLDLLGSALRLNIRDAGTLEEPVDPVTHIGSLLERTRLSRVELSTQVARGDSLLRGTQSTVRVTGDYAHLLQFVRAVELGPPLATVDALAIEPLLDNEQRLEGRFTISIWSAVPGGRP